MYKKHLTIYGGALGSNPPLDRLKKYDRFIVSPSTYAQLPKELKPKALVYLSLFCWPRYMANMNDWQFGPGNYGMPAVKKVKGGESYIYQINWDYISEFMQQMQQFALKNKGMFAGFFLEDWQRSHSWWMVPNWEELTSLAQLETIMHHVEFLAEWLSAVYGSDPKGHPGEVIALSGYPGDFSRKTTKWYCESFGASWHPIDGICQVARSAKSETDQTPLGKGMFIQVNSADSEIREQAVALANEMGGSVGMQPDEGVLSYDDVEDPDSWPV